jgi:hypothetical protein
MAQTPWHVNTAIVGFCGVGGYSTAKPRAFESGRCRSGATAAALPHRLVVPRPCRIVAIWRKGGSKSALRQAYAAAIRKMIANVRPGFTRGARGEVDAADCGVTRKAEHRANRDQAVAVEIERAVGIEVDRAELG